MKSDKLLLFITILLIKVLCFPLFLFSGQNNELIEGIWLGTLKLPGAELRIGLTLSKTDTGTFTATMNSIDQGSGEIPMDKVKFKDPHLVITGKSLGVQFEGDVNYEQGTLDCEFRQGFAKLPLLFQKVDYLPVLSRPQEPKRPLPYHEEMVDYENVAGSVHIAATLTCPDSGGPFPAVILLTGSGAQNRDEEIFGHKPFLVLSDYLTRRGIAVLRADDRGIGGTSGSFQGSTTGDFAEDALAGVKYLLTRNEIDPDLIGLVGHSEGAMMASIAASESDQISFIVLMAGVGIRFDDIIFYQKEIRWKAAGMSEDDLKLQREWHNNVTNIAVQDLNDQEITEAIQNLYVKLSDKEKERLGKTPESIQKEIEWTLNPWHRYASRFNARKIFSHVRCPVLAINGSKDTQVPADINLDAIEKACIAGGNNQVTVKKLDGLNHLFQTAGTGFESEYAKIDETMSPEAMKVIADWIQKISAVKK